MVHITYVAEDRRGRCVAATRAKHSVAFVVPSQAATGLTSWSASHGDDGVADEVSGRGRWHSYRNRLISSRI